jgi:hypothetical protein
MLICAVQSVHYQLSQTATLKEENTTLTRASNFKIQIHKLLSVHIQSHLNNSTRAPNNYCKPSVTSLEYSLQHSTRYVHTPRTINWTSYAATPRRRIPWVTQLAGNLQEKLGSYNFLGNERPKSIIERLFLQHNDHFFTVNLLKPFHACHKN